MFKSLTLELLYIPVYLMHYCWILIIIESNYTYMYVCVGTTIQKKGIVTASVGTYICGVLVNDGYLYSRVYGTCMDLVM